MRTSSFQSLKNHFLIAMPQMADPSFAETLTLICEHSPEGALGVVINRPTDLTLGEIFRQVGIERPDSWPQSQNAVYAGGPVAAERGFVLHSNDRIWESSLSVGEGLNLTTSKDILVAMAQQRRSIPCTGCIGLCRLGSRSAGTGNDREHLVNLCCQPLHHFSLPPASSA